MRGWEVEVNASKSTVVAYADGALSFSEGSLPRRLRGKE